MDERLVDLHTKAGLVCGEERTCGKKVRYNTEETATKSAKTMMDKGKARNELEPYPCPFCKKWHIGREMSMKELENWEKEYDKMTECYNCYKRVLFTDDKKCPECGWEKPKICPQCKSNELNKCKTCDKEHILHIKIIVNEATPDGDGWQEIYYFCSLNCFVKYLKDYDGYGLQYIEVNKFIFDKFELEEFREINN